MIKKIEYYKEIYGDRYKKALNQINNNIDKPILDLFDVGKFGLTEVLFMERCLKLLKKAVEWGLYCQKGF